MAETQQQIKDNFSRNLKAEEYFAEIYEVFVRDLPELFRFMITFYHDVFSTGNYFMFVTFFQSLKAIIHISNRS